MKTKALILLSLFLAQEALSFCGFYVTKAGAKLVNKASQVIMVRDGQRTVITMANDFSGSVNEFAMIVPVPQVLKENQIRVANQLIFDKLDAYSAPRMAEYYDENPCNERKFFKYEAMDMMSNGKSAPTMEIMEEDESVTIEASYTVGEYDILILSAKESDGLKTWLTQNDYKIPENAEEVLEPYIKSSMKFFVVKVNLENQKSLGFQALRPLQITFESQRFMLPIRLGMANAEKVQDLVIYTFTKNGAAESTNYRTVTIPTDVDVPVFVQDQFNNFYQDLFTKAWNNEGQNVVFKEYAWDLSSSNYTKCDPCSSTPPDVNDLEEAGVFWLTRDNENGWGGSNYEGELFFTRFHVRYDRKHFPQDLMFQATPNKERTQGRYVIRHPYTGKLTCDKSTAYIKKVIERRKTEMQTLARLTGWSPALYPDYVAEWQKKHPNYSPNPLVKQIKSGGEKIEILDEPDPKELHGPDTAIKPDQIKQSDELLSTPETAPKNLQNPPIKKGSFTWLLFLMGVPVVVGLYLAFKPVKK
ncbi:MAG: DUF2330 domain-containing protein [Bacteroidetes bacterium]|nr:DUF2330 domain-containing protein [Bacteroidota bacterium]